MSRGPDAATLLERALGADARNCALTLNFVRSASRRWASATFTGARIRYAVEGSGTDAARWLGTLPDADLPVRGHCVAEIAVLDHAIEGDRFTATIEALTVEEG